MHFKNANPDKIWSVTEFTGRIKTLLEDQLPPCWVRGEISNLRIQSSGHAYFTLKDAESQIAVVLFRNDRLRQKVPLTEGAQLILYGEINIYPPKGAYQIVARFLLQEGIGKLQLAFERLKKQLSEEGLFDPSRKRPISQVVHSVAIITSPTGAVLQDFISILKRRQWPGRLIVVPTQVQGTEAADQIVRRIQDAQKLAVDVIVIARGGGSLEDLWAFNEEKLVRQVAACLLPVISAVGHETDFSLCDFAADRRAETPSAAAELIANSYSEYRTRAKILQKNLLQYVQHLFKGIQHRLARSREKLSKVGPEASLRYLNLRLDELQQRFQAALTQCQWRCQKRLAVSVLNLSKHEPTKQIQYFRTFLQYKRPILSKVAITYIKTKKDHLHQLQQRLNNTHYQCALKRGFVWVQSATTGQIVSRCSQLKVGDLLQQHFYDGSAQAKVMEVSPEHPCKNEAEIV